MIGYFYALIGKRIVVPPKTKVLYPDSHGYTGFSIHTWDIPQYLWNKTREPIGELWEDLILDSQWGGFRISRYMVNIPKKFVLEGRLFAYGSLLCHALVVTDITESLLSQWKPIMDEIYAKEKIVYEKNRSSKGSFVHIDQVINEETAKKLNPNGLYLNRSKYFSSKGWK